MPNTKWCCFELSNEEGRRDGNNNDDDDVDKDEDGNVDNMWFNYSNLSCNLVQNVIKICIPL